MIQQFPWEILIILYYIIFILSDTKFFLEDKIIFFVEHKTSFLIMESLTQVWQKGPLACFFQSFQPRHGLPPQMDFAS